MDDLKYPIQAIKRKPEFKVQNITHPFKPLLRSPGTPSSSSALGRSKPRNAELELGVPGVQTKSRSC
jgi:hypothetical protein